MLAILGWLLALMIAACLFVAAWPQGLGLEQAPVVAQVVSMRVGVIGIALVLALLFLLLVGWRRVRPFVLGVVSLLLVFSLVSGGIHVSRGVEGEEEFDVREGDVVVLTWNTLGDAPGVDEIVRVVQETGADIVTLPETTGGTGALVARALGDAGDPFYAHTTHFDPGYGALNTTLLIATSVGDYRTDTTVGQTRTLPTIVARPESGDGPVIVATHPVAPVPNQMRNWRADLDFVASLCDGSSSVIMGGDFNSTLDHWASLGTDGGDIGVCRDAASEVGAGAIGTWPTWAPAWLGTQIDHVVATPDWEPVAARVLTDLDDGGTDHRPVLVQLRPAG